MPFKRWVLGKVNAPAAPRDVRRDPQAGEMPGAGRGGADSREPTIRATDDARTARESVEHLGIYGPLIAAIREELEHFVASQVRLHLAIAERDRYVLTAIDVDCEGNDAARDLLRRFIREFKPEQIKDYLAKEVIAGLRNASAIDLTQFAGLDVSPADAEGDDDAYGELLAELRDAEPEALARPYQVTLVGRWSPLDSPVRAESGPRRIDSPQTPLAGRTLALDIEDAGSARRVELASVLPGRRYAIGKAEGCDVVVDGMYASRRHCEIWLEKGAWWVADAGSTNGIRVESASGLVARSDPQAQPGGRSPPIELAPGARLVLSAYAQGDARQYPRLTPVLAETAQAAAARPGTPVTPIAPPRRHERAWTITARMASGVRAIDVGEGSLPFRVGRSRNQALVIDAEHEDVSGHHFDIVAVDESGASVVVHGDNGVRVNGKAHKAGARFRWKADETLILGRDAGAASSCALTLSRAT
jgi:FHA domain-containing protein